MSVAAQVNQEVHQQSEEAQFIVDHYDLLELMTVNAATGLGTRYTRCVTVTEEWRIFAAYVVAGGILLSLLLIVVTVTTGFRYAKKIEQRVSTPSGSLSSISQIWSEALVGRLVRCSHIFAFLVFRNCSSRFCHKRASMLGDPDVPLPRLWQAWCLVPVLSMYGTLVLVLLAGIYMQFE